MEWISFSLDSEQKRRFETQLMPTINGRYKNLMIMADQSWSAYSERCGIDTHRYLFCCDSPIINKFVRDFAGNTTRLFATPDTSKMLRFGAEDL